MIQSLALSTAYGRWRPPPALPPEARRSKTEMADGSEFIAVSCGIGTSEPKSEVPTWECSLHFLCPYLNFAFHRSILPSLLFQECEEDIEIGRERANQRGLLSLPSGAGSEVPRDLAVEGRGEVETCQGVEPGNHLSSHSEVLITAIENFGSGRSAWAGVAVCCRVRAAREVAVA